MTSTITETKTERLILNLTVQERHKLKEYHQQSNSASESEFVRKAVELFAVLYRLVVTGSEIVLRNVAKRHQHTIPIAKKWTRDSVAMPERETPRRNFELKIEEATKEMASQMVKEDAAPSLTRLVWLAIGTYAHVLEWEKKDFALMEQRGGKFLPIERSLPHFRETIVLANEPPPAVAHSARLPATLVTCVAEVDHKTRSWPDEGMFGTSTAPKAVTTRDVLLYAEGRLPRQAMVWINHPEPIFLDGDANAIAVVERNCLMGCEYVLVTNRADASHLREAVKNFLFPRLKWKHYRGTHVYDLLKNKLQNEFHDWTDLPEVNENNPDFASPIWMQFHAIVLQDANEVLAARYHDSPSWIFEFHAKGGLPHDVVGFSIGRGEFVGNAMRRPDWETQTQLEVLQNFKTTNLWKRLGPCDFAANEGLPTTAILSASGRPTICKGAVEP